VPTGASRPRRPATHRAPSTPKTAPPAPSKPSRRAKAGPSAPPAEPAPAPRRPARSARLHVPKVAELIAQDVRDRISRGELREGDWLPSEAQLVAEFGVSRPTMREAMRVLESEGLVSVSRGPQGGAQVHAPTEELAARHAALLLQIRGVTPGDLFEARAHLEGPLAGVLAQTRTARQLKELRALVRREREHDPDDVLGAALVLHEFHLAVVEMAGNETMRFLTSMVQDVVRQSIDVLATPTPDPARMSDVRVLHKGHEKLVDLIEARDAEGAEAFWRAHVSSPSRARLPALRAALSRRL
jgi:DNA-binding FadR family transcriptional regulator